MQVESHVLRYWEDELELPIMRNEMGHRYYTEQDIKQLQEIKQLKEQGLQLKAIRTILLRMPGTSGGSAEDVFMQRVSRTEEENIDAVEEKKKPDSKRDKDMLENSDGTENKNISENGSISGNMIESMSNQTADNKPSEMDIDKPQRFVVALSKEKESLAEPEQEYENADKSRKAARLQYLLQHMITEAVKSANKELCSDVKESILKELDYQFRMQEERDEERWKKEEEHYRKIDEMIRERHRPKERLGRGKKKSPARDESINL